MTDVSFYHLLHHPLSRALPQLLDKVCGADLRAVVKAGAEERVRELDELLWTYDRKSFLPHAPVKAKFADHQPILLTTGDENPAGATVLVLVDSMESDHLEQYDRCLEMFDGGDQAAVAAARVRWKKHQAAGHNLTYWQQNERGGWTKKASGTKKDP